jgi:glycosyltransferase involved in cell wall biosynthesis
MRRRPVVHVISGLGIGGAEASLIQIATHLQARGVPQHIVCAGSLDDHADDLKSQGVNVTVLGVINAFSLPLGISRLARLIRELNPGVVQGWMYHGNILAALAHRLAGRRGGRRLYWNLRASNVDDERYGRVLRVGALMSRWPDLVIANSQAGAKFHIDRGFRPRQIDVIRNGVDTRKLCPDAEARAAVRAEFKIPADAVVAIHAARVDPMKDHALVLAAMAALPQIHGLLVGAGTEALTVPPNVRALGMRRDLARLYAAADIVISSSAFAEGFSNVIAEGMSVGLTPIATDVGDSREIVGDCGYVVPARDVAKMTAALAAAAREPAPERLSRGLGARARIVERFPLSTMVDAYAKVYESGLVPAPSTAYAQHPVA